MESYFSGTVKLKASLAKAVKQFTEGLNYEDFELMKSAQSELGEGAALTIECLRRDEFLLEDMCRLDAEFTDDILTINETVWGSSGLDMALLYLQAIGPACQRVKLVWSHDEEPPEDEKWPLKLGYDGKSPTINGRPVEVPTPDQFGGY